MGVFLLLLVLLLIIRVALFARILMDLAAKCTPWTLVSCFHRGHGSGLFRLDHILSFLV